MRAWASSMDKTCRETRASPTLGADIRRANAPARHRFRRSAHASRVRNCSRNSIRRSARSARAALRRSQACAASGSCRFDVGEPAAEKIRRGAACREFVIAQHRCEKRLVGRQSERHRVIERLREPLARLVARRAMRDHLGDHGVVERRNLQPRNPAHDRCARPAAGCHNAMPSRLRQEIPRRVLGAEPRLDRVAVKRGCPIAARVKRLAHRDAQLPLDQIDAGDRLGHRMLDLQPRVHLHEVELSVARRAGTRPCRRPRSSTALRERDRGRAQSLAQRRIDGRRGRSPRSASGAAAAPSSRARRDARRCRAGRRKPAPRCGVRSPIARSSISRPSPKACCGLRARRVERRVELAVRSRPAACRARRRPPPP